MQAIPLVRVLAERLSSAPDEPGGQAEALQALRMGLGTPHDFAGLMQRALPVFLLMLWRPRPGCEAQAVCCADCIGLGANSSCRDACQRGLSVRLKLPVQDVVSSVQQLRGGHAVAALKCRSQSLNATREPVKEYRGS